MNEVSRLLDVRSSADPDRRAAPNRSALEQRKADVGAPAVMAALQQHLMRVSGRTAQTATLRDWFLATAALLHQRTAEAWAETVHRQERARAKQANYLSMEFLIGRLLTDGLNNLGLLEPVRAALLQAGVDYEQVAECEPEPGLGNGGLGRLAACLLDSCATLDLPCWGYGIRYEFGLFRQAIRDGWQWERPDPWLRFGYPWEVVRPEVLYPVSFYGRVATETGADGRVRRRWIETETGHALAHDVPVSGYQSRTVNTLRLWSAHGSTVFDLGRFNAGDHLQASEGRTRWEDLSRVLYPDDSSDAGRVLRFKQHYFLASASLQDILQRALAAGATIDRLPDRMAVHINDTHPVLGIVELMRLLIDEQDAEWDRAWDITRRAFSYTNHTLMPEALESWPLRYFESMLPRHLEIIREISDRLLRDAERRAPGEPELLRRLSILDDRAEPRVRMAHIAVAGSHAVNGVSRMHTALMRETVFADWHRLCPDRIACVTNGVTPRRWLGGANPDLAALVSEVIGDAWLRDLGQLERVAPLAEDTEFRRRFRAIKAANKDRLASRLHARDGLDMEPDWLLDVQIKRIHEYKRQLLNLLHCLWLFGRLRGGVCADTLPRTVLFAGKAAPGYAMAKLIVKLIHDLAEAVDADPTCRSRLRILFMPNYSVSDAQTIIPAADLSEQISTAGTEASGTSNMKLALNGALTIGTLDGANIELSEAVGAENMFIFGHRAEELVALRQQGYDPWRLYHDNVELRSVLDDIAYGRFLPTPTDRFRPLFDSLMNGDKYFLLADFASYLAKQGEVERVYREPDEWARRAIINMARIGELSSDRAASEYARRIWGIGPVATGA